MEDKQTRQGTVTQEKQATSLLPTLEDFIDETTAPPSVKEE